MNKELEALERVKYNLSEDCTSDLDNALDIVESALKDFEYLKSLFSIEWFDNLPTEDKFRVMKIMGVNISYE